MIAVARAVDELLDGLLQAPVQLEDTQAVQVALLEACPGHKVEVYCHDARTVNVVVWREAYRTGPAVRRTIIAAG